MLIVLIDGNAIARGLAETELRESFPGAKLVVLKTAGEFLRSSDEYLQADLLILDHELPLIERGGDAEESHDRKMPLLRKAPALVRVWKDHEGGSLLIGWVRKTGMRMPVILHTVTPPDDWNALARDDKNVFHSFKRVTKTTLSRDARLALG